MAAEIAPVGVDVKKIDIQPNKCPIDAELGLTIYFDIAQDVPRAYWIIQYIVDTANKRHVIEILSQKNAEIVSYRKGQNVFAFKADKVDVAGVKPQLLRNVGLLVATMKDASTNGDIVEIKMVTQVMNKNDGSLIRNVIDPLE